ncbi:hypothetical protein NUACC21_82470 [Scytonema sp. NUACC21]
MSDTVIRVENLSKKYVLNHQQEGNDNHKTLRDVIVNGAKAVGKGILKPSSNKIFNRAREEFWALKDVSFEIKQGHRVGIIGRNGAGKSTLLKILSRIVEPTNGRIRIKGRVASLLEVGTGFHPELTGRENVFLNGAILGMSRVEIQRKFDEIVAFAEVEKFLDTPVKRYSSGMYVRLAFAVAAHLEPEILIVDEVLAVGDIEFQKKCLGKMQDVSNNQGRTVLFVSHNMETIQRLCSQCVMLEGGKLFAFDNTAKIVTCYLSRTTFKALPKEWIDLSSAKRSGTGEARFTAIQYSSLNEAAGFQAYSNGPIEFLLAITSDTSRVIDSLSIMLYEKKSGIKLINVDILSLGQTITLQKGHNVVKLKIEELHLKPDVYMVGLWLAKSMGIVSEFTILDCAENIFEIEVVSMEFGDFGIRPDSQGVVTSNFKIVEMI